MAQKRKTDHRKSTRKKPGSTASGAKKPGKKKTAKKKPADDLDSALDLLDKIEEKTARAVEDNLTGDWRDNLFEILMTRVELAAPHKKLLARLPDMARQEPSAVPRLVRRYLRTMKRILKLAGAPRRPHHIAAFGVLYASIIDVFLKDDTRDHAKTMAALDKRLGLFEQFAGFSSCNR